MTRQTAKVTRKRTRKTNALRPRTLRFSACPKYRFSASSCGKDLRRPESILSSRSERTNDDPSSENARSLDCWSSILIAWGYKEMSSCEKPKSEKRPFTPFRGNRSESFPGCLIRHVSLAKFCRIRHMYMYERDFLNLIHILRT